VKLFAAGIMIGLLAAGTVALVVVRTTRAAAAQGVLPYKWDADWRPEWLIILPIAKEAAAPVLRGEAGDPSSLLRLRQAHQALPVSVPRPITCLAFMDDAVSKSRSIVAAVRTQARESAQRSLECYEGMRVDGTLPSGSQQPHDNLLVAFEHLGAGIGPSTYFHAVLMIQDGAARTAFEALPSGKFPNFGWLLAGARDLQKKPLRNATVEQVAGATAPPSTYTREIVQLTTEINRSRIPYNPTPEIPNGAANSNTFVYSVLTFMHLRPPAAPPGYLGSTPGYYAGIIGFR
jgi:hypothetical protein